MSDVRATTPGRVFAPPFEEQRDRSVPVRRDESGGRPGWLVAGAVAAGLGCLAWYHFGPDLRRYLKIKSM